jgi:electron transfer flavoprotein alpha subunit
MASDIAAMVDKNQFRRAILAGNALSTVEVSGTPIVVTVRQSAFDPAPPLSAAGEVQKVAAGTVNTLGAEFVKLEATASDRPDLNDAKIVVSGGRGMKNGENFKVLEELADLLGAAMGASRAATDAGFVPADWQVGQTGKIVAPNLYFCVAISGAIQADFPGCRLRPGRYLGKRNSAVDSGNQKSQSRPRLSHHVAKITRF